MTHTENYNLNIVEGSDKVNLLTQMNPNTTAIDAQMKDNADHGIQDATELFTSTVHAITRQNTDAPIFRFTAVSNYTAGETFTVDGVQVTALLTSGEALTTGSFIIGSEVICALRDTLLTVFVNAGTAAVAKNAEKLGGELPEYYGTAEDVADAVESAGTALETATAASTAVGNLSSLTTSSKTSAVSAINEVNENLTNLQMDLLWTNPNPTSGISTETTYTIQDVSSYDFLEVYVKEYTNPSQYTSAGFTHAERFLRSGGGTYIHCWFDSNGSNVMPARVLTLTSNTSFSLTANGQGTNPQNRCIPMYIYGGKFA